MASPGNITCIIQISMVDDMEHPAATCPGERIIWLREGMVRDEQIHHLRKCLDGIQFPCAPGPWVPTSGDRPALRLVQGGVR